MKMLKLLAFSILFIVGCAGDIDGPTEHDQPNDDAVRAFTLVDADGKTVNAEVDQLYGDDCAIIRSHDGYSLVVLNYDLATGRPSGRCTINETCSYEGDDCAGECLPTGEGVTLHDGRFYVAVGAGHTKVKSRSTGSQCSSFDGHMAPVKAGVPLEEIFDPHIQLPFNNPPYRVIKGWDIK